VLAAAGVALAAACSDDESSQVNPYGTGGSGGSSGSSSGGTGGSSGSAGKDPGGGTGGGAAGEGGAGDAAPDGDAAADATCTPFSSAAARPAVDIVWIVDDSFSLSDEIAKIRANISTSFVPAFDASGLDWQVIVISRRGASSGQVCLDPPLAGAACADNPPRFHQIDCDVGSDDSLFVAGTSYTALGFNCTPGTPWGQLARYEATKAFVEVSDDDAAGGTPFSWDALTFDGWALTAQPAGVFGTQSARRYVFYSIVGADLADPTQTCTSPATDAGPGNFAYSPGTQYQTLSAVTGGLVRSICEDDWASMLDAIAGHVVDRLACELVIPTPEGGTVNPDAVTLSYTPDGAGGPGDAGEGGAADAAGDADSSSNEAQAGAPRVIPRDDAPCAQANGWQWNADQSRIVLCGAICDEVRSDASPQIEVDVGCEPPAVVEAGE
jgi:hypothetical protein